jgi:hypothetical protein
LVVELNIHGGIPAREKVTASGPSASPDTGDGGGRTMLAFALLALAVAPGPFRRRERWPRNALALAVLVWPLPDTAASLAHEVWTSALLNAGIALLLATLLVATWRRWPVAVDRRPGRAR